MACTIDDTVGGLASNSYVSIADSDAYIDTRMAGPTGNDAWVFAIAEDKCRALQTATRFLDHWVEWDGVASSYQQRLAWPRWGLLTITGDTIQPDEIPDEIKYAATELALILIAEDVAAQQDQEKSGLTGLSVGSVSLQFARPGAGGLSTSDRVLPPHVFGLIQQWVRSRKGGGSFVRLGRA